MARIFADVTDSVARILVDVTDSMARILADVTDPSTDIHVLYQGTQVSGELTEQIGWPARLSRSKGSSGSSRHHQLLQQKDFH